MTTTTTTKGAADSALIAAFKTARRVSTPLVAIETPDPGATIAALATVLNAKAPTLQWDIVRGLRGLNKLGQNAAAALAGPWVHPVETLDAIDKLPEGSAVFFHNFHRQMGDVGVVQGLWNVRDTFKLDGRMAILLGPTFTLPTEIAADVVKLVEPLPTRDELTSIVVQQFKNASLAAPDEATLAAILDAVVGLPAYTVEQIVAMSLTPKGVDLPMCWERKVQAIEANQGLSVWKDKNPLLLADLKGIDNAVRYMQRLIDAGAFSCILFIDEGDKALDAGMSDYSGDANVGKDQVKTLLTWMVDEDAIGVMLAGLAGTGKTELAKALAATSGKPLVMLDLGEMKGGIIGTSEANIRGGLKVVNATAEGKVLVIMTANKTTSFTPEMNRRFPTQFFFDEPSDAARAAMWPVHITRSKLTPSQAEFPAGMDAGWTGAEIKRVCAQAAMFGETVVEAAADLIPQAVSARKVIDGLRAAASGKFLSASHPGKYQMPGHDAPAPAPAPARTGRKIDVGH